MTSSKTKIDTLNGDKTATSTNALNPLNANRDNIFTAIEVSKRSGVPVLLLSNPGNAKSTAINLYGKIMGYHVESVIASQYSPDEILGYQVNSGKDHLEIKTPEWFNNIMEFSKEGTPSILFLDEISMASEASQGALLQVCFERKIRSSNKNAENRLPEDCIVVSAANYKGNLPSYANIIAPTLNRFLIVNQTGFGDPSMTSANVGDLIIDEFTQCGHEVDTDIPQFGNISVSDELMEQLCGTVRQELKGILNQYRRKSDASNGFIDLTNQNFDGMYEGLSPEHQEVYNFISGRTVSYYIRVLKALVEMDVQPTSPIVRTVSVGLLGLGSNNWEDAIAQAGVYQSTLTSCTSNILGKFISLAKSSKKPAAKKAKPAVNPFVDNIDTSTISGKVNKFKLDLMGGRMITYDELSGVLLGAADLYKGPVQTAQKLQFRADYEAIRSLKDAIEAHTEEEIKPLRVLLKSTGNWLKSKLTEYEASVA